MSTPSSPPLAGTPAFFRPHWFFVGLTIGLIVMSWLGRRAASSDYHPGFQRFFPAISPEASYYPTVGEMMAIVRARCGPDQVLVIIGGNSVLQGVWQPPGMIWSEYLQEELGSQYCVINLAQRGAAPTDGGAIVAEALRREFPRQVYIANEKPGTEIPPLGNATYRFIFWDAYFKGWLLGGAVRAAAVRDELWHQDLSVHAVLLGTGYLDRLLRFQDFWNRMAMEKFNSVPSQYAPAPPGLFSPRKLFQDTESDVGGYDEGVRYRPEARDREMEILRATAGSFYEATADGGWQMMPLKRSRLTRSYARAFPQPLHSRTLLLVGRDSPYYRDQLTPAAARRDEQSIRETVELMRDGGYAALDYGRDFSVEDYGDRTHLAVSGGRKLAEAVAPAVRAISARLNYLR